MVKIDIDEMRWIEFSQRERCARNVRAGQGRSMVGDEVPAERLLTEWDTQGR